MARERIIVKIALHKLQRMLRKVLRGSIIDPHLTSLDEAATITFYAFCLKFLRGVTRINDVLEELAKRLEIKQSDLIRNLSNNSKNDDLIINPPSSCMLNYNLYSLSRSSIAMDENLYFDLIYPLSRGIEAISMSSFGDKEVVNAALIYLAKILEKMHFEDIFDSTQKLVPIVQAFVAAYKKTEDYVKKELSEFLKGRVLKYTLKNDPNLDEIYSQDIYFLIKINFCRDQIENEDKQILIEDLRSKVFRKLLKGLEYLAMLKIDPPPDGLNRVIRELPNYFGTIFKIGSMKKGIIYFSSPAESIHNILQWFNDKTFASVVMSLLIGDTGWIARDENNLLDVFKTIIGSSLLIATRSALRR